MSGNAGWLHPTTVAGSTRLYMVGAFAGAVVLLGLSVLVGWPILASQAATDPASVAASATSGTCLTWTKPDASDLGEITCGQPHLFEVTGSADISAQYPAGAPFPDQATWQKVAQTACTPGATAYLGKLDPYGRFVVGALKPTSTQWDSGDRTMHCGLQRSTPTGQQLVPTTGSARAGDQSNVYPVGTCLALLPNKAAGGPVPCGQAHSFEIVGTVNLHDKFPTGYPSTDDQQTALGQLCQPIAASYTNGANLGTYQLTVTWDTIKQESWSAGSVQVNCKVGYLLSDGSGLGPVSNSIKGIGKGAAAGSGSASPSGSTPSGG